MKEFIWKHEDAVIVNALVAISVASINFAIAYAIIKKANRKYEAVSQQTRFSGSQRDER